MNKPIYNAYVVVNPKEGTDRKAIWHKVGSVWPHQDGDGFDLVIAEGIAAHGRIVIRAPLRSEEEPAT